MIRILPPDDSRAAAARRRHGSTSSTGSCSPAPTRWTALMQAVVETGGDVRSLKGPHALRRRQRHRRPAGASTASRSISCPREFRAEALVAALATRGLARRRARAAAPRRHRPRGGGRAACAMPAPLVTDVVAYRTVLDEANADGGPDVYRMLLDGELQVVTFTSASAVRNFAKIYGAEQAADLLSRTVRRHHRPGHRGSGRTARHQGARAADAATPCRRWSTPSSRTWPRTQAAASASRIRAHGDYHRNRA